MDLKWISLTRILMLYSILEFFINIIFCIILSFIKCEGKVSNYFCKIVDINGDQYLDNIFIFFDNISKIYRENNNYLIYIICIIFVDMIIDSLFTYFLFLILKNLAVEFLFFAISIEEIFDEIIKIFERKVFKDYYFVKEGKDIKIAVS